MFPREFIEGFLKDYSQEEKAKINKDLKIVKSLVFEDAKPIPTDVPTYLATAGGPGSGKSTTLETFIKENKLENFVYADPDQVCLKNMNFTYRKYLDNYHFAQARSNREALYNAYTKWRAASNYINYEILQSAFGADNGKEEKYSIAHGTTSTNPQVEPLYNQIKSLNYRISFLLCYSPEKTRIQAIETREKEQAFVQIESKDIESKGIDFPKRFDIYFKYADEITFFWNEKLEHGRLPISCAKFIKHPNNLTTLTVTDPLSWEKFCKKYLEDCKKYSVEICKNFEALIPKKLLVKAEEISPHVLHSLHGVRHTSCSVGNIEYHKPELFLSK